MNKQQARKVKVGDIVRYKYHRGGLPTTVTELLGNYFPDKYKSKPPYFRLSDGDVYTYLALEWVRQPSAGDNADHVEGAYHGTIDAPQDGEVHPFDE